MDIPDDIQNETKPIPLSYLASGVVLPDADANRVMGAAEPQWWTKFLGTLV